MPKWQVSERNVKSICEMRDEEWEIDDSGILVLVLVLLLVLVLVY